MCNLYNEERVRGKDSNSILDSLESFLKLNPVNIINFCLDNPINSIVQIILASCFRYGKWVEKDEHKAFNYYQNLAKMEDSYGIYLVGVCYHKGNGVEEDKHKAFIYYQKSTEMGNSNGLCNVGYCYRHEIGVEKDEHKAFIYCQKSAEMDNSNGLYDVGYCYQKGIGVEKDEYKAFIYYQKSAEMGTLSEQIMLDIVMKKELELIRINIKDSYIIKKLQKWGTLSQCVTLEFVTNMELVLKSTKRKRLNILKNQQKRAITEQNTMNKKEEYFHWIPYDKFENTEEIGKGAFSTVFKTRYLKQYGIYEEVAIKIVKDSNKNKEPFLKELKACHSLEQYLGISRDKKTKDYILVLSYAKYGSLKQEERIYGVLPYIAPELFQKKPFTKASDIYSFGIIMVEMTTGQRSFNDYKFNFDLVVRICNFGLRPKFAPGTLIAMLSWQTNA
ncbi:hypothetical protein C2G38_2027490 [Gigaspora rosea]|uniref:Protein kinase domain-containing protein n=1 Tax=Gigaspora rosea TaxID=44941 RepID=A0A397W4P8_9GLOM|nr:hypothetical protein C2G38_2027490 [Gigaspora rosea]